VETGQTGIQIDYNALDRDGVFRIGHVVPESPAAVAGIKPGEYIHSIAGVPLSRETNINRLLAGTEGLRLAMAVSREPGGRSEEIDLKPTAISEIRNLEYMDWVEGRRHVVDSLSGGRLAYIHIPRMARNRLEIFKQELVSIAESKDGLIIDVRDNGGGNIAVHLLGILVKTPYLLRNFRGFPTTSENKMRSKALEKPMALLINNYSASNSEIFAEGFRKLKLGKIIGEPTSGAVIGTSSYTLIDGSRIRRPSWGAYTAEMEDTELKSRQPDILVENLPDDFMNGRDPQLVRAVQELMSELP
jgi:C-terminal processing protease CtpA/Prc